MPPHHPNSVATRAGSTFAEIVDDPASDVLIEFYAPWCGHCKTLEPKYKKIAKKLAKVPGIVLAKIDATANDYPTYYEVEGCVNAAWMLRGCCVNAAWMLRGCCVDAA